MILLKYKYTCPTLFDALPLRFWRRIDNRVVLVATKEKWLPINCATHRLFNTVHRTININPLKLYKFLDYCFTTKLDWWLITIDNFLNLTLQEAQKVLAKPFCLSFGGVKTQNTLHRMVNFTDWFLWVVSAAGSGYGCA
jgi:hypothetical protein